MKKATNAVLGRFGRRRKRRLSVEIWVLSRGTGVGLKSLAWTRAWEGGGTGWLVRESGAGVHLRGTGGRLESGQRFSS